MSNSVKRMSSCVLRMFLLAGALALPTGAASALEVGDRAPSFNADKLTGEGTLSLDAYKGKVVYLDFWASWCGPCLKALPMVDKMRKDLPAKDFAVVAINVDRDKKAALRFLKDQGISYPSAADPDGRLPQLFQIETMPTSFVIDRKGVIHHIHRGFSPGDMDSIRKEINAALRKGK